MKTNSQIQLSNRLYLGDIDGNQSDELLQIDGRHLYVFRSTFELDPVLEHVFTSPIRRLIIGDFVSSGREHGRDQICAILEDGSLIAFAISDDLKSFWWWFTQPNFISDDEHYIVGDFDGDGADEVMVYKPSTGSLSFYSIRNGAVFSLNTEFSLGNLAGFNLKHKQIFAGEFGQATGRKDLLIVDRSAKQIMRFDAATDAAGVKTFWWAFTSKSNIFSANDQLCVANITGAEKDGLIIRNFNTGKYRLFNLELNASLNLQPAAGVSVGQLPIKPRRGTFIAAKVRNAAFRGERGGLKRDDVLWFDEPTGELVSTDARFDTGSALFTYWWSFHTGLLFEPNGAVQSLPWAVILCRFRGLPPNPTIENFFRQIFTPGSGGMVEYWHDVSLGKIDISGSRVFGWVELDMDRLQAGGVGRGVLIDAAIAAARRDGLDPTTGFHSQIAVFTHKWAKDGAPAGADWSTPGWGPFWIDGSSDGLRVSAPDPEGTNNGTFLGHEMAHGYGFGHDLAADLADHYGDPNCIMSAMRVRAFAHPSWNQPFGPALSFPQLMLHNWMYTRRVHQENSNWVNNPLGVVLVLAPISDRTFNGSLGIILPNDSAATWSYYLEYMKPTGWNSGIGNPKLVIRRIVSNHAAFLGEIDVPPALGLYNEWTEPHGNVSFKVERNQADGRAIKITAKKII